MGKNIQVVNLDKFEQGCTQINIVPGLKALIGQEQCENSLLDVLSINLNYTKGEKEEYYFKAPTVHIVGTIEQKIQGKDMHLAPQKILNTMKSI